MEKHGQTDSVPTELLLIREQIDRIDQGLVLLLANRFALTRRVGNLKAEHGLSALDPQREEAKLKVIRALCKEHDVSPDLVADILAQVMREVVANHKQLASG
ncbi:MAG: chorismate mutase [Pseudomonadales bacterium]|nr:chorismate mutase [Pseudomonadales bacterium]